jgi:signal-transduction protein with cAMP-binding, CBS, and nucleotidyltransferase domain
VIGQHEAEETQMNVGHLCQRNAVTVQPADEIATAARLMREKHIGFLVVVEPAAQEGHVIPVGVITDRDIVVSTIARDIDPKTLCVGDVMTCNPAVILDQESVADAVSRMRHRGVRRLPVVGDYGHLAGVISLDDILTSRADEIGAAAAVIARGRDLESTTRG